MEEKKIKKKQTLTISSKKPYRAPSYTGSNQKKSFVIEKKISGKKQIIENSTNNETQIRYLAKLFYQAEENYLSPPALIKQD